MNYNQFKEECNQEIKHQSQDPEFQKLSKSWLEKAQSLKYSYHFEWLGRPIIQYPQDIVLMQEVIWTVKPDLIIETGIAHGGSIIFSASMLELNAICGVGSDQAEVIGIDIDIRPHNREAIEAHPMFKRISLFEGSSIDPDIVEQVKVKAKDKQKVLVCLDSLHTHQHVLSELEHYAPLTTVGSYCIVFDTMIEDLPNEMFTDRPWGVGDNPKTAVKEYLNHHAEFEIDQALQDKLMITVAPHGYLKRMK